MRFHITISAPMPVGDVRRWLRRQTVAGASTSLAKHGWRTLFFVLWVVLAGCDDNRTMGMDLVGFNHTDTNIGSFHVNDAGGPFLMRHTGGGKFTCCISIPRQYRPGMTVQVGWQGRDIGAPQERTVEVPPYRPEDGGMFAVHFLRNGQIKVFVTMYMLWHPNYPLKGDEAKM
jgi:Protein of unknown function (DUF3304)